MAFEEVIEEILVRIIIGAVDIVEGVFLDIILVAILVAFEVNPAIYTTIGFGFLPVCFFYGALTKKRIIEQIT